MKQFDQLLDLLDSKRTDKDSRKVANNTYVQRRPEGRIAVKLHQTDVLMFSPNGRIELDSGGWTTPTTKERINRYLPGGYSLVQERGVWYLLDLTHGADDPVSHTFKDGMVIHPNGRVIKAGPPKANLVKLKKQADKFSRDYIEALFSGKVDKPSAGDCWFCVMVSKDGQTMGETMKGSDHMLSHIKESYFVPSLILTAARRLGASQVSMEVLGCLWGLEDDNGTTQLNTSIALRLDNWSGMARDQLGGMLRRYVRSQVGLAR